MSNTKSEDTNKDSENTMDNINIATDKPKKQKSKKKRRNRCHFESCNKKLSGAALALSCKCGHKFCMQHFNCTSHNCDFDYKNEAKEKLIKQNVLGGGEIDKVKDRL